MTPKIYPLIATLLTLAALAGCGGPPLAQPEATPRSPVATPPPEKIDVAVAQVTATPAPPTASPTPALSPLDESLQTIIFTTSGEQGPEIWRVQVDEAGQKAGPVERVEILADSIYGAFPSPDGRRVAIWSGGGYTTVDILDITNGQLIPLFNDQKNLYTQAKFFDWTPDGQSILIMGIAGNPDMVNRTWLVNINTHEYHRVGIKQDKNDTPQIGGASFSPDGTTIVYTQFDCFHCDGSQVWQIMLDNSEKQLLFEEPKKIVTDALWSPSGNYIAFVELNPTTVGPGEFIVGELQVMDVSNNQKYLLGPIVTHLFSNPFRPQWSPNGELIAFVKPENTTNVTDHLDNLSSNIYVVEVSSKQIYQLTHFENTPVLRPTWSPDSSRLAFLAKEGEQFEIYTIATDKLGSYLTQEQGGGVQVEYLGEQSPHLELLSFITWIP